MTVPGSNLDPNAPVEAGGDPYALTPAWSRGGEYKKPFDYRLEDSGQLVRLRRLDMGDLLRMGIAEELDFMSKALVSDSEKAESAKEAVSSAITKANNFGPMEKMINAVVVAGVNKPKLQLPPRDENARQVGQTYVDSIPFTDRVELFSVIFESEGLSTFRKEQAPGVGDVADVASVSLPADRPVADVPTGDAEGVLSE